MQGEVMYHIFKLTDHLPTPKEPHVTLDFCITRCYEGFWTPCSSFWTPKSWKSPERQPDTHDYVFLIGSA
jgi:hypothetical protein